MKSMYYALIAVLAPASFYEIIWTVIAILFKGWIFEGEYLWLGLALLGWVILGVLVAREHRLTLPAKTLYVLFVVLWVGWIATGFHFNIPGSPVDWVGEAFNIATKAVLSAAYAVHICS